MQKENEKKSISFVSLSVKNLQDMLAAAATTGAMEALRAAGVGLSEWRTRAELSRMYGKRKTAQAINSGLQSKTVGKRTMYSVIDFNNLIIR